MILPGENKKLYWTWIFGSKDKHPFRDFMERWGITESKYLRKMRALAKEQFN